MSTSHPEESAVITERLRRQCLLKPATTEKQYLELFRSLQPVSPVAFTRPGDPPTLPPRTRLDDRAFTDRLRRDRRIVKGRFLGGSVAYVFADDLPLYANAFRRRLDRFSLVQTTVLEAIQRLGPITSRQLKEETGILSKRIGPALQRLQESFLVYEDQVDDGWDRPWYDFSTEWPSVSLDDNAHAEVVAHVVDRFLWAHVFATFEQVADWSELRRRTLEAALRELEAKRRIQPGEINSLGQGWMHRGAPGLRESARPQTVAMLHRGDFLVRSHRTELQRRYGHDEVLQYLLVDGSFLGAVLGHWGFGPYEVEDIVLELPAGDRQRRKDAILAEVRRCYGEPSHPILRYAGKRLRS